MYILRWPAGPTMHPLRIFWEWYNIVHRTITCKHLLSSEYIYSRIISRTAAKSLVSYLRPLTIYLDDSTGSIILTHPRAHVTGKYLQVGTLFLVFAKRYHMNYTGTAIACLINNRKLAQIFILFYIISNL